MCPPLLSHKLDSETHRVVYRSSALSRWGAQTTHSIAALPTTVRGLALLALHHPIAQSPFAPGRIALKVAIVRCPGPRDAVHHADRTKRRNADGTHCKRALCRSDNLDRICVIQGSTSLVDKQHYAVMDALNSHCRHTHACDS